MNSVTKYLRPVKKCLVVYNEQTYIVVDSEIDNQEIYVKILNTKNSEQLWVKKENIKCGFNPGMDVKHIPKSHFLTSLGVGVVHQARIIAQSEQVLVEFVENNTMHWLPYESLACINSADALFMHARFGNEEQKLKLRCLAYALELWNENTGSLSRFDIDALPHQIHLVFNILKSGNLNWMIADDVGLGKTIEVGLLLSALIQRKQIQKVLLVTPAGLTRQWLEELSDKFGIRQFRIYGEQFTVESADDWKRFPWVIASIDRLKTDKSLATLSLNDDWDLVIFDEAHRLTRREYGKKYDSSQRFKLASALRGRCESLLLLTATPHQGKPDQFRALLELIRPSWRKRFRTLEANPEILRELMIRNDKSDVTDADGNFIFQGKTVKAVTIESSKYAKLFDNELTKYITNGYKVSKRLGTKGNAIGFVMTIYRKLASSSAAAIHKALKKRLIRLTSLDNLDKQKTDENIETDIRFISERDEDMDYGEFERNEFYEGESIDLKKLINMAVELIKNDIKIKKFTESVLPALLNDAPNEKILIFTEYKTTQKYLKDTIESIHGANSCSLIHGSMKYNERLKSIADFEDNKQFLISTEAGGEGINLQKKCHIAINYDLPWNPSRITQRIGRLYRYGQKKKVFILNVRSEGTFDENLIGTLYDRINQVIQDMSTIGREFQNGLEEEILGEFIDSSELTHILNHALEEGITRTTARIEKALERAKIAAKRQIDLFSFAQNFDPDALKDEIRFTINDVRLFATAAFNEFGIEVLEKRRSERVWEIRLPADIANNIASTRRLDITFDRDLAAGRSSITMLDLTSPLIKYLLRKIKDYNFGGLCSTLSNLNGDAMMAAVLRWQTPHGKRMRQEFSIFTYTKDSNNVLINSQETSWLTRNEKARQSKQSDIDIKKCFESFLEAANKRLTHMTNENLHPETIQWVSGGKLQP